MNIRKTDFDEFLAYNPDDGVFIWLRAKGRARVGEQAGHTDPRGYVWIGFDGKLHLAHRLAWLFVHGDLPPDEIDHWDGNKSNNRIKNLRLATSAQNKQNLAIRADNASGHPGVSWCKIKSKWRAYIVTNKKQRFLGYHDSVEAAGLAYVAAKKQDHKFEPNVRGVTLEFKNKGK